MTINFDTMGAATDPATGRLNRQHAQARQGRWMFELERATLSFGGLTHPDQQAARSGAQDSRDSDPQRGERADAPLAQEKAAHRDAIDAASVAQVMQRLRETGAGITQDDADDQPAVAAGGLVSAVAAHDTGDGSYAPLPAQAVAASSAAKAGTADSGTADVAQAAMPASAADAASAAANNDVQAIAASQNRYSAAQATAAVSSSLSTAPAGMSTAPPGGTPPAAIAAASARVAVSASPRPAGDALKREADEHTEVAAETEIADGGERADAADAAADSAAYENTKMHVFRDESGVQAWIRDAGLSEAQALAMAYAMTDELSDAGAHLQALTVNGKRLSLSPQAGTVDDYDEIVPDLIPLIQTRQAKGAI